MGFNTTVVILNDALHDIKDDPKFGENLYRACVGVGLRGSADVPAGCHANAARVVESHHADGLVAVLVGGNTGECLGYVGGWTLDPETEEGKKALLQSLASSFGFEILLKKKRKARAVKAIP